MDPDIRIRTAIEEHWQASERGDIEAEHAIYAADAILDYPQSGERFRGRETISAQRGGHPASRHFTVRRIIGGGDLWVSECVITYDGVPTFTVSTMEFAHGQLVHETQYFADAFGAPEWRAVRAVSITDMDRIIAAGTHRARTGHTVAPRPVPGPRHRGDQQRRNAKST